jgi:hypothetical protein
VFYRLYNDVSDINTEPKFALSNARHDAIKRHNNMTTIHEIRNEFRKAARSNRDMGDKFERLIATYLITDPLQAERFSDVWLWNEWSDHE